ncbi:MAG: CBS domain-containing protein, partial [Myxococcota bacterium]
MATGNRSKIKGDIPDEVSDEAYFDEDDCQPAHRFDEGLLQAPISVLSRRIPMVFTEADTVQTAVRAMQAEHRGVVLISEDGTRQTPLKGIFTERDVLLRVVDRGNDPSTVCLREVMAKNPESLERTAPVAAVLNKMSVGGFRHVPIVDSRGRPVFVVSVRDVVE